MDVFGKRNPDTMEQPILRIGTWILAMVPLLIQTISGVPTPVGEQYIEEIKPKVIIEIPETEPCFPYRDLIVSYDWPILDAIHVCGRESEGYANAINWKDRHYDIYGRLIGTSSQGLFQIASFWPDELGYEYKDLLDPVKNTEMAYEIWLINRNFKPWTTNPDKNDTTGETN